jgi:hypothetical protein
VPTILRLRGLRVVIYTDDHWPPQAHVIGAGRGAKIALGSEGGHPSIVVNEGLSRRQLAAALAEINRNRDLLMHRRSETHGDA